MEEEKSYRELVLEMISNSSLKNQKQLNEAYMAYVVEMANLRKLKYFDRLPKHDRQICKTTLLNFRTNPIYKSFLQKRNVILSPNLWRKLMLTEKINLHNDFVTTFDEENKQINMSQLKVGKVNKNNTFFLRIIKIKLPDKKSDINTKKISNKLDEFIKNLETTSIEQMNKFIDNCEMFSVHEYLLPDGYVDEKSLESAVLLFRTERVYHITENDEGHNNWGIPAYFEKVFPKTISEQDLIKELHFHFAEGFGSVYRLEDVSDRLNKNNFSAGYAIPLSMLRKYINALLYTRIKPENREFFYKNDFGMHFLYLLKEPKLLENILELMYEMDKKRNSKTTEVIIANKLADAMCATNIKCIQDKENLI